MANEIKLPELGENIEGGDVVTVHVSVGDVLEADQSLMELETGKATVDVPSPEGGKVKEILVHEGDHIEIGQVIILLEDGDAESEGTDKTETSGKEEKLTEEKPSESDAEPQKKTEHPAPPANKQPEASSPAPKPQNTTTPPLPVDASIPPVAAAPSVRRFAREIGIDVRQVPASGEHGRISLDDVKDYAKQLNEGHISGSISTSSRSVALPDFSTWGSVEKEKMSTVRKLTAEHMAFCWATIPHVTQHDQADITELNELRKRFASKAEARGGKLTVTAILIKIIAAALKAHPKFNASIDMENQTVIYKKYVHIGVAVDTPKGLFVPIIRNVDEKNIIEISLELGDIAARARDGKLKPEELQGGSFTLTNLGGIGGTFFTPIVNHPEVAILGTGRSFTAPTCGKDNGICRPRTILPLSLSYDHRLIDGADGARFIRWIVDAIEEPLLISLEG